MRTRLTLVWASFLLCVFGFSWIGEVTLGHYGEATPDISCISLLGWGVVTLASGFLGLFAFWSDQR